MPSRQSAAGSAVAPPQWERATRHRYPPVLGRVLRDSTVRVAGGVILAMVVLAIIAPLLPLKSPEETDLYAVRGEPSSAHWLGTDEIGRDVLSRLVYGARVSMFVGLISVSVALVVGVPVGLAAGFRGGAADTTIMRIVDVIISVPPLLLAIAITSTLGVGIRNAMIGIGLIAAPGYARLIRGEALVARELDYVTAARSIGAGNLRLMFVHVFPATWPALIVQSSLGLAFAILTEAALSFLGLGVQPPMPSWGGMLRVGYPFIQTAPWMVLAPGAAIFVAVLAFNVLGDALRDVLDPRLRNRTATL